MPHALSVVFEALWARYFDAVAHERFDVEPVDERVVDEAQQQIEDERRKIDTAEMREVFANGVADRPQHGFQQA